MAYLVMRRRGRDDIETLTEYSHSEGGRQLNDFNWKFRVVFDTGYLENERLFRNRPDVSYLRDVAGVYERFAVRLNEEHAWFDCLTFQYEDGRGNIRESEKENLRQLIPHVAKAVELSRVYSELRNRYRAVLSTLDRLRLGVFIVSPSADIVLSNTTAEAILSQQNGLHISRLGKLATGGTRLSYQIDNAIKNASNVVRGVCSGKSTKLVIPKTSENGEFILDIAPLIDTDSELEKGLTGALITIIDTEMYEVINLKGLMELYKLSAAEVDVADQLMQGRKYTEIANNRGVTSETVKTQVNSIYSKTGSNSRSELFARILKINLPIL